MSAAPPVTVITSTYNWPKALQVAIRSVLQQRFGDFEYWIVGDHCTDETEEVVREFKDPRIRWVNLEKNTGNQADVYIRAIPMTRGKVIAYLNHDDIWFPDHLEKICQPFADRDLDIVSTLALSIKPPGILRRDIVGVPAYRASDNEILVSPMTSNVAHTRSACNLVGGWKSWRSTTHIPTLEFFGRLRYYRERFAVVPLVTSLKFHSGDRRNSYVKKLADEQEFWFERMQNDPELRHEQIALASICEAMGEKYHALPVPRKPENAPPGWQIEQWRRLRGLHPMMDLGASEPGPSDEGLSPPKPGSTLLALQEDGTPIVDSNAMNPAPAAHGKPGQEPALSGVFAAGVKTRGR